MLRQLRHAGRIGTFIALTLLAGNIGFAAAQTSTPILVAPVGTIGTGDYPISIHQGTCESPVAQPDYTLTNATPWAVDNEKAKEVGVNPDPLVPVSESVGDASVAGVAVIEKGKGLSLNLDKDSFDLKDDQARITVYLSRL